MHFRVKNTLKNNWYHTFKHSSNINNLFKIMFKRVLNLAWAVDFCAQLIHFSCVFFLGFGGFAPTPIWLYLMQSKHMIMLDLGYLHTQILPHKKFVTSMKISPHSRKISSLLHYLVMIHLDSWPVLLHYPQYWWVCVLPC
jgi:hypothetical protein